MTNAEHASDLERQLAIAIHAFAMARCTTFSVATLEVLEVSRRYPIASATSVHANKRLRARRPHVASVPVSSCDPSSRSSPLP
jgi:hypothetical protein